MIGIFEFDFMRRAFISGILISLIIPCIGVIIVLRRMSMIGDSLSHNSLAGVAIGLTLGINPVLGAVIFSVIAAFGIEKIRRSFPKYTEISIAVVLSIGVGLAGIFSGFVKSSADFSSFLFGSIVAISDFELALIIVLSILVLFSVTLLYKELFFITFDEEAARLARIPVRTINFIFTLLTAVSISISSRTVGTLVVSSLMILPVAAAIQIAQSYRQTVVYSVIIALATTILGLFISYYADLKPGGTIVLVGVAILIFVLVGKNVFYPAFLKSKAKSIEG